MAADNPARSSPLTRAALDAIDRHYEEHRLRKQQSEVEYEQPDPFAVTPQRTISLAERKHNARELVLSLYPTSCEERSSHLSAVDLCNDHEHLDAIVAYLHNHKPHDARQFA